jgi:hypothetical protein
MPSDLPVLPHGDPASAPVEADDRRRSGGRGRARDRLMDRATRSYPVAAPLARVDDVENLLLFIDDDLRETALAMARIEEFLVRTLGLLEQSTLHREVVHDLASDTTVLDQLDLLNETVESLRRRMAKLAQRLR